MCCDNYLTHQVALLMELVLLFCCQTPDNYNVFIKGSGGHFPSFWMNNDLYGFNSFMVLFSALHVSIHQFDTK